MQQRPVQELLQLLSTDHLVLPFPFPSFPIPIIPVSNYSLSLSINSCAAEVRSVSHSRQVWHLREVRDSIFSLSSCDSSWNSREIAQPSRLVSALRRSEQRPGYSGGQNISLSLCTSDCFRNCSNFRLSHCCDEENWNLNISTSVIARALPRTTDCTSGTNGDLRDHQLVN
jgi:hypothetical protein